MEENKAAQVNPADRNLNDLNDDIQPSVPLIKDDAIIVRSRQRNGAEIVFILSSSSGDYFGQDHNHQPAGPSAIK